MWKSTVKRDNAQKPENQLCSNFFSKNGDLTGKNVVFPVKIVIDFTALFHTTVYVVCMYLKIL